MDSLCPGSVVAARAKGQHACQVYRHTRHLMSKLFLTGDGVLGSCEYSECLDVPEVDESVQPSTGHLLLVFSVSQAPEGQTVFARLANNHKSHH